MKACIAARPLILCLALCAIPLARAQWSPPNPVLGYELQPNALDVRQKAGLLRIEVDAPGVLHITYTLAGESRPPRPSDHVVIKTTWPAAEFHVTDDAKAITLTTAKLKLVLERGTGALHYFSADGALLNTDSYRSLQPDEVNGEQTFHAHVVFSNYGSHEGFFGLGQHQAGVWNYHGAEVDLSQENTEIAIPLVLSSAGYGIFWNNPSRSRFNNRFVHTTYFSAEVADRVDYYFLYGPDADTIIGSYRELTGEVPLFGRWAYGFWQCKNKYASQQQLKTSPPNTAPSTSRSTTSSRTGSGGPTWAK